MSPSKLIMAVLYLASSITAVDIRLYNENRCNGIFGQCVAIDPGACCHLGDRWLGRSTRAIPQGLGIQAFSQQGGDLCGALIGGGFECWGVSNDIESISGAKWSRNRRAVKRNVVQECTGNVEMSHVGMTIEGKDYLLGVGRYEYQVFQNLTTEEEQRIYIKTWADTIKAAQ
ncbi:hypothetical protein BT63DRAFT_480703 [Microthyrium microscopicum]|uniref:Uncharacterized protein n=1 Tax=Microthyrium microscopicum TaxID=703497 RepID=A0A6A6U8L7_9PEZI|nr:hypothetical protein BT63DRAFT_480703 [Microthyrium microscopicum]